VFPKIRGFTDQIGGRENKDGHRPILEVEEQREFRVLGAGAVYVILTVGR
jgi:hypothetical protein